MKINAKITMLFNRDGLCLEVEDDDSGVRFLKIELNQEQVCEAMSRLACTSCASAEVKGLDKVGKKLEMATIFVEMPKDTYKVFGSERSKVAVEEVKKYMIENSLTDWVPDFYFGSTDAYCHRDNKFFCKCTIRRWVDKE
jgi:hypothetical protein